MKHLTSKAKITPQLNDLATVRKISISHETDSL